MLTNTVFDPDVVDDLVDLPGSSISEDPASTTHFVDAVLSSCASVTPTTNTTTRSIDSGNTVKSFSSAAQIILSDYSENTSTPSGSRSTAVVSFFRNYSFNL